MPSLLVTNDFPPKFGGIQSYLYELWRRLPPGETTVLTTPHAGAAEWDAQQPFRVERIREPVLLPTRALARRIDALAREVGADVIFLDPVLPLGRARPAPHRRALGRRAARRRDHGAGPPPGNAPQARTRPARRRRGRRGGPVPGARRHARPRSATWPGW